MTNNRDRQTDTTKIDREAERVANKIHRNEKQD